MFYLQYFVGTNNYPYCEVHYNEEFGDVCVVCNTGIQVSQNVANTVEITVVSKFKILQKSFKYKLFSERSHQCVGKAILSGAL